MFPTLAFWFCLGLICWPCIRGLLYLFQSTEDATQIQNHPFSSVHLLAYALNGALTSTILAAGTTLDEIDAAWNYHDIPYAYVVLAVFSGGGCGGTIAYFGELFKRSDPTPRN